MLLRVRPIGQVVKGCRPVCGGAGIIWSRAAIDAVDWARIPTCPKDSAKWWYDKTLGEYLAVQSRDVVGDPRLFAWQLNDYEKGGLQEGVGIPGALKKHGRDITTVHYSKTPRLLKYWSQKLISNSSKSCPHWQPRGYSKSIHNFC